MEERKAKKAAKVAEDELTLAWINDPDNANDPDLEAVKKQYYLNRS